MSTSSISDFPDRFSPMLVKELRQGLRAKTFLAVFLSLQASLALILLSASASASSDSAGTVISAIIFVFFAIAVLIVQPLRGIGSISSEIKGNTIDMMVLTRLSASRIVFGKWFAIVSQSALLLATIVPYLILRYFFGGMNLVGEIVFMGLIFLSSMALTAVTVGLSGSSSIILRALLPIVGLPVFAMMMLSFVFSRNGRNLFEICSLDTAASRAGVAAYICAIAYIGWSMLSLGASLIAPAAENHATLRRLIALALTVVATIFMVTPDFRSDYSYLLFTVIAMPAIGSALTERSFTLPNVRESFLKRGLLGRIAALFLAPGWPSGVFFTVILSGLFGLGCVASHASGNQFDVEEYVILVSLLGTFIFPAVLLILFRTDESTRTANYLLLLMASGIFTFVMYLMSEALSNNELLWFLIWSPLTLLPLLEEHTTYSEYLIIAGLGILSIYLVLLIGAAISSLRKQRDMARAAAESPQ